MDKVSTWCVTARDPKLYPLVITVRGGLSGMEGSNRRKGLSDLSLSQNHARNYYRLSSSACVCLICYRHSPETSARAVPGSEGKTENIREIKQIIMKKKSALPTKTNTNSKRRLPVQST